VGCVRLGRSSRGLARRPLQGLGDRGDDGIDVRLR
jgi:hypothetical protein